MSYSTFKLMMMHRRLDDSIRAEQKFRWPDVLRIQRLKKLKLVVRDRIVQMSQRQNTAHNR